MNSSSVPSAPVLICLDLEGVLVPEIWIGVARKTRLKELERTTRDEPDYGKLMRYRMEILRREGIRLRDIQSVIASMEPLPGAGEFLKRLRALSQVIVLSDTFSEFAFPLMQKLGFPTIFCNRLVVDRKGFISGFILRQKNGKQKAVQALKGLGFEVRAAGDSYNDVTMLQAADRGIFFNPPSKISKQFSELPVTRSYSALFRALFRG